MNLPSIDLRIWKHSHGGRRFAGKEGEREREKRAAPKSCRS
jgi:hypothetical protein